MSGRTQHHYTDDTAVPVAERLARLKAFIGRFDRDALAIRANAQSDCGSPIEAFRSHLTTYLNEAQVGLELVAPALRPGARILEVGCGVGILTAFLSGEGFDVVGIEPGAKGGFGFMPAMSQAIAEALPEASRPVILPIGGEDLDPRSHGSFDLIFSVNVIEHVMQLDDAIAAMTRVLSARGRMMHLCPNYAFPYEPHLAIPLLPGAPNLTRYVFPRTIERNKHVWNTVNFVTAGRIRALARMNRLSVDFEPGVMGRFFDRVRHDKVFSARHPGIVGRLASSSLAGAAASRLLSALPASMASPMIFTFEHVKE